MDISLDLETWGTKPGCDIRSIGACVLDPATGFVAGADAPALPANQFYIACDNPTRRGDHSWSQPKYEYDLHRDPATVQWWSEQSDEAQAAFADPVDLREALERFTIWLNGICTPEHVPPSGGHTNIRLWSHGAAFDPPILATAYDAVGLLVPWHYRAPRDTRTLFDAAGIEDHSALLARHPGPLGLVHHALDDSICQARAVCAAYALLRDTRDIGERVP
jgi:3' exoribonuclease, RNase T-like